MKIIIQAGGKGTRLEGLTRNKPKCIVPVNNLPILFYAFKKFSGAEFTVIADYKIDVLEKYLSAFATDYKYKIVKAPGKGTISGIKEAIEEFEDDEPVIILWCDIILSPGFEIPSEPGNYIGISKDFECRLSYVDGKIVDIPSKENGIAGLFVFENKKILSDIPQEGALVEWLKKKNLVFKRMDLYGTKEVGTLLAYEETNDNTKRCRPFNSVEFNGDLVVKKGITEQGKKIAVNEVDWYKFVKNLDYRNIPEIYEFDPLKMKRVRGKNIYEYDCITTSQKREIILNIVKAINELHNLVEPIDAIKEDLEDNYLTKTFSRLLVVKDLVPFAKNEFIKINGRYYKNVFYCEESLSKLIRSFYPEKFHLIHGDCTFSNVMFDTFDMKTVMIDPRGYFGKTKYFGDKDYDWAKLYYSLMGDYDQFNLHKFTLDIKPSEVELKIKTNGWSDMEEFFFDCLPGVNKQKIKLLHSIIWLSLTTYAWEDYDSICGAFYNGVVKLNEVL